MVAIIDIGSNSTKMRIYKNGDFLSPLYYLKPNRLSSCLDCNNMLSKVALNSTLNVLMDFCNIAKKENVKKIYAYATEALRLAKNSFELLEMAKVKLNLNIEIISGEDEAKYGFYGVKSNCDGEINLIDIGGASTEIITGNNSINSMKSYKIGAVKLKDNDFKLEDIFKNLSIGKKLIGIGGTITTILLIRDKISQYSRIKVQSKVLYKKEILNIYYNLINMDLEERKKVVGLSSSRADIICYGIEILLFIMNKVDADLIVVSDFGTMEGYMKLKGIK